MDYYRNSTDQRFSIHIRLAKEYQWNIHEYSRYLRIIT